MRVIGAHTCGMNKVKRGGPITKRMIEAKNTALGRWPRLRYYICAMSSTKNTAPIFKIPAVVRKYFAAANQYNARQAAECFTSLATVHDEGREYNGRNGIFAALLAREGMTAPAQPFEGRDGLRDQVTGNPRRDKDLRKPAASRRSTFAARSHCRLLHPPFEYHWRRSLAPSLEHSDPSGGIVQ